MILKDYKHSNKKDYTNIFIIALAVIEILTAILISINWEALKMNDVLKQEIIESAIALNILPNEAQEIIKSAIALNIHPDDALECYQGKYDNDMDFIYDYVDSCGILDGASDIAKCYFDYESYLKDIINQCDLVRHNNHYFWMDEFVTRLEVKSWIRIQ